MKNGVPLDGVPDASLIGQDRFSVRDSLQNYNAYIRLVIDGIPAQPFSMQTLPFPAWSSHFGQRDKVIRVSRERYSGKRQEVEEKIARWTSKPSEAQVAPPAIPTPAVLEQL